MNNKNKTNINWYPGHMAKKKTNKRRPKTNRLSSRTIRRTKYQYQVEIRHRRNNKRKKKNNSTKQSDLAEEKKNQRWLTYYSSKGIPAVLTDSQNGKGIGQVINKIEEVMKDKKEEMDSKGRTGRKIRVMILGIQM